MPGFDGTGPLGQGSLSGRGSGYCIMSIDNDPKNNNENIMKGVSKMPGGDRTGPKGMGSMTGRGAGYCAGNNAPGYMNSYGRRNAGARRGMSAGNGRGRGYRNWYYATGAPGWSRYDMGYPAWGGAAGYPFAGPEYPADIGPNEEIEMLKDEAQALKQQLDDIQSRMKDLKKSPEKKEK